MGRMKKCPQKAFKRGLHRYPGIVVCPKDRLAYYKNGKKCKGCDRWALKREGRGDG